MMRRLLLCIAIVGSVLLLHATNAYAANDSLMVMTTTNADMQALSDVISDCDLKIVRDIYSSKARFHIIQLTEKKGTLSEAQRKLVSKKNASIRSIEVTPVTKLDATPVVFPNDPDSTLQYALPIMKFNAALKELVHTGFHQRTNPHVTVIDTGIKLFPGEMDDARQYNFVSGANGIPETPFDSGEHGTAVSSVIAATTNNRTLLAGIGTNRLPVAVTMCRISNDGVTIDTLDVIDALTWCIDNQVLRGGPGAINVSLNSTALPTYNGSSIMQNIALELRNQGDLFVNGSGNMGIEDPSPELYIRRVGATDQNNLRASFSNFGPFSAYAPGVEIVILFTQNNGLGFGSGTSLSTPQWAGAIAFLQSFNPILNAPQLDSIVFDTATITSQALRIPNFARALPRAVRTR